MYCFRHWNRQWHRILLRRIIRSYILAEGAATVIQLDHLRYWAVIQTYLALHLLLPRLLTGLPQLLVHHERHLGAGPGVDPAGCCWVETTSCCWHRDNGSTSWTLENGRPRPEIINYYYKKSVCLLNPPSFESYCLSSINLNFSFTVSPLIN